MRDAEYKREENLYKPVQIRCLYKKKNYMEGLYKKGIVGKGCIKN